MLGDIESATELRDAASRLLSAGGALRDRQAQARVRIRLKRIEAGNFGDCDSVGDGVLELREHLGAGYRVYLGRHGQSVVILLCGGSKKTQIADIKTAKDYWADWKRRQE